MPHKLVLWPHQIETAKFLETRHAVLDCSDPGTGKTRAHLAVAVKSPGRVLIVCPKTLMRTAWGAELRDNFPRATYAIAEAGQRAEAFESGAQFVILNTDGIKDVQKNPRWLKGFDRLIIDEISMFKHGSAQRTKAIMKLSKVFLNKAGLTGTPNANSVTELWSQVFILDEGERLGTSFFKFRNAVQIPEQIGPSPQHLKWIDKPQAESAVYSLLSDILIRHRFEDVMKHVPPNHRSIYRYTPNAMTRVRYAKLAEECVLALKDRTITAVHAASLRSKLLQLLSGAVYTEEGQYSVLDTQRYDLVTQIVSEYNHSLVFFNWRHQRDLLCSAFEAAGYSFAVIDGGVSELERSRIVTEFQAGHYKTLLLHPKTGAHGLTLTQGEACVIASPFYEADLLKQAIHRIYRGAQDKVTNTILIEAENTVERLVYARVDDKTARMDNFLQLVEESLQ